MPFSVIKGTFHTEGYSPDGESVRFRADYKEHWAKLSGPPAELNAKDHAQLHFEALSRAVEKNGRPVSFVYADASGEEDRFGGLPKGSQDAQSPNHGALEEGVAYPTYYEGLFHDLREALTEAVGRAREAKRGVWAEDRTNAGFEAEGLGSITNEHVVMPKLFRRLAEYLHAGGSVAGFKEFLEAKDEELIVISTVHPTHFDTVVEVEGNMARMIEPPENLIFEG